jgi:hypothetical protein
MAELTDDDVLKMKQFLTDTCADVKRWLPEPEWSPGWQSDAAGEWANSEQGPGGPWGPDTMLLSLFSSGCRADFLPGRGEVREFYGGRGFVPGAVLAWFPDGVGVVAGSLDGAWVGPLAAGVEVPRAGDLGDDLLEGVFVLVRGERPPDRRPGGG